MEPNLIEKISTLEAKVDQIWQSVEKTRKSFQITMWVTLLLFVVPLFLLMFVVPIAFNSYVESIDTTQFDIEGFQ